MLCDILFTSCCIEVFPQLKHWLISEWSHEACNVHSCLFCIKTSNKEEEVVTLSCSPRCRLYGDLSRHIKECQNGIYHLNFLKKIDIIWKMILCFLSKVTIYKTGSFLRSSTHAVAKTMLCLFSTHEYRTERPVPKFSVQNLLEFFFFSCRNRTESVLNRKLNKKCSIDNKGWCWIARNKHHWNN